MVQSVERAVYIRGRGGEEDIGPVTADLGCPGVAAVGGGEGEGAGVEEGAVVCLVSGVVFLVRVRRTHYESMDVDVEDGRRERDGVIRLWRGRCW